MSETPTRVTRSTPQKKTVQRALREANVFLSAQQLHRRLEDDGSRVGLATVYRQLAALAETDQVDTITIDGEQMYRACADDSHHHHLVCEVCGKAENLDLPSENWLGRAAAESGFRVTKHVLEVFGVCSDCDRADSDGADRVVPVRPTA